MSRIILLDPSCRVRESQFLTLLHGPRRGARWRRRSLHALSIATVYSNQTVWAGVLALTGRVGCGDLSRSKNRPTCPHIEREVGHVAGATEEDGQLMRDGAKGGLSTRPSRRRTAFTHSGERVAPLLREYGEGPMADMSEHIRVG